MKINIAIVFLYSFSNFLFGQNLVKNPSFELSETKDPPLLLMDGNNNFTCDSWISPTSGTPNYFSSKRIGGDFSAPKNCVGYIKPYDGNAYVGIDVQFGNSYFEYIQIQLKEKLSKESNYCLSLFISPALSEHFHFTTNEMDYFLSSDEKYQVSTSIFKVGQYERFVSNKGHFEANTWNQISSCFKAKGEEEYLTIGILNKDYKRFCLLKDYNKPFDAMYFYIDKVSLVLVKDSTTCNCNEFVTLNNYDLALNNTLPIRNVYFEGNKAVLLPSSNAELKRLDDYLKLNPLFKIELLGYTDNVGKEKDNVRLSTLRAKSIAEFLIKEGINKNRIIFKGLGSRSPIESNETDKKRALNNRIEIKISK